MIKHIEASLREAQTALEALINKPQTLQAIATAGERIVASLSQGGKVYACGNGGSMCDASHFAEELTGRYRNNRRGMAAISINDPSHLSCVANDFGYDQVFSRYLESHGNPGDVLLALSTSGNSPNVIKAIMAAKELGMTSIVLTGRAPSPAADIADLCICTPGGNYADRVQELHIKVLHILIELIERRLCPENYPASA